MKKYYKILSFTLFTILLLSLSTKTSLAEDNFNRDIKVVLDGQYLGLDGFSKENKTYVALRELGESLGYNVDYDGIKKLVILNKDNNKIEVPVNSNIIKVNGIDKLLINKNFVKDGLTYIPIREFSEILNKKVEWDGVNKLVIVGNYPSGKILEDTYTYIKKDNNYAIDFPETWKKEVIIEEESDSLKIYDRTTAEEFTKIYQDKGGPVLEIRVSDRPVVASFPSDSIILLDYDGSKYTEALLDDDFQFTVDTVDSYNKIKEEASLSIETYRKIELVLANEEKNKEELKIVRNIRDNWTVEDIFNNTEIYTNNVQDDNNKFFYIRNMESDKYGEEVKLKIELDLNKDNKITRYHLKSYGGLEDYYSKYPAKKLLEDEIDKRINDFFKEFISDKNLNLGKYKYKEDNLIRYNEEELGYSIFVDGKTGLIYYITNDIWEEGTYIPSIF